MEPCDHDDWTYCPSCPQEELVVIHVLPEPAPKAVAGPTRAFGLEEAEETAPVLERVAALFVVQGERAEFPALPERGKPEKLEAGPPSVVNSIVPTCDMPRNAKAVQKLAEKHGWAVAVLYGLGEKVTRRDLPNAAEIRAANEALRPVERQPTTETTVEPVASVSVRCSKGERGAVGVWAVPGGYLNGWVRWSNAKGDLPVAYRELREAVERG